MKNLPKGNFVGGAEGDEMSKSKMAIYVGRFCAPDANRRLDNAIDWQTACGHEPAASVR